jgi:hypothetical protein
MVKQEMPGYSGQAALVFGDIFGYLINLFFLGFLIINY